MKKPCKKKNFFSESLGGSDFSCYLCNIAQLARRAFSVSDAIRGMVGGLIYEKDVFGRLSL